MAATLSAMTAAYTFTAAGAGENGLDNPSLASGADMSDPESGVGTRVRAASTKWLSRFLSSTHEVLWLALAQSSASREGAP